MNVPMLHRWFVSWWSRFCLLALVCVSMLLLQAAPADASAEREREYLKRAKIYLVAADYRRAIEACLHEVEEAPSAESYVYLTYVYHALDGYLEHLARTDKWVAVEQLYINLALYDVENLVDSTDVLARIAKEVIHTNLLKHSDVSAAMAARLDRPTVWRLWKQQTAWREARPDSWWTGAPEGWAW